MKLLRIQWVCVVIFLAATATAVRGDIPQIDPKQGTLQAVLDRIHAHAANDAWKQGGFTDEAIEKWLDKLVASVSTAANFPELKVPARLANVKPPPPANPMAPARIGRLLNGALIVAKDADLKNARWQDSIVLADGAVDVDSARGCVIIARGPVTVRSSSYSIIVSGIYVRIAEFDGEPRTAINGSLIVSRSRAEIGTPYGSLIVAPDGVAVTRVSSRSDPIFINTPAPQLPRVGIAGVAAPGALGQAAPAIGKMVKAPDLPVESIPKHPLADKIELVGAIKGEAPPRAGFVPSFRETQWTGVVFRFGGRRYVADLGEPIANEAGDRVPPLESWRLTFVTDKLAVFSSDSSDALIEMPAQ